jgi:hypothetical protein
VRADGDSDPRIVPITAAMHTIIVDAYTVFGAYRPGIRLNVCHCGSCMSEVIEAELRTKPLREIDSLTLAEYTNSAHIMNEQSLYEVRYFLPRYLELIADDDYPDVNYPSECLRRLNDTKWSTDWPPQEAFVLHRFFAEFLFDRAQELRIQVDPDGSLAMDTYLFGDSFELAVTAGVSVTKALSVFEQVPELQRSLILASLRTESILDFHGLRQYVLSDENSERIRAALMVCQDAAARQVLAAGLKITT